MVAQQKLRQLGTRLQFHSIPLATVVVAIIFGQFITFYHHPTVMLFTGDSTGYLDVAHRLMTTGQFIDAARPPGYPALLALIFLVAGDQNLNAVIFVQASFMMLSVAMVYLLTVRLSDARWMGAVVASLMATNSYLLAWEREILSETFAILLVVLTFLMLERYLHTHQRRYFVAMMVFALIGVFNRPFFLYLPALLVGVLVVQRWRTGQLQQEWPRYVLAFAMAYGLIFGYMVGNKLQNNYFGLTYVSSVNLFGKIIEYQMQNDYTDPQYQRLGQRLDIFVQEGNSKDPQPFVFLNHTYPEYQKNYYAYASGYTQDIIMHQPLTYGLNSLNDAVVALGQPQIYYNEAHPDPEWARSFLRDIAAILRYSYFTLPLLSLAALIWWWRKRDSPLALMLIVLSLTQIASLLEIGFASYANPYRLRVPLDWSMLVIVGTTLAVGGRAAWARIRAPRLAVTVATPLLDPTMTPTTRLDAASRPTVRLDVSLRPTKRRDRATMATEKIEAVPVRAGPMPSVPPREATQDDLPRYSYGDQEI